MYQVIYQANIQNEQAVVEAMTSKVSYTTVGYIADEDGGLELHVYLDGSGWNIL
jgi:hypothetical protein